MTDALDKHWLGLGPSLPPSHHDLERGWEPSLPWVTWIQSCGHHSWRGTERPQCSCPSWVPYVLEAAQSFKLTISLKGHFEVGAAHSPIFQMRKTSSEQGSSLPRITQQKMIVRNNGVGVPSFPTSACACPSQGRELCETQIPRSHSRSLK